MIRQFDFLRKITDLAVSGLVQPYVSGIPSGYNLKAFDNGGNPYSTFLTGISGGKGYFSGTAPVGTYVLEFNGYFVAKAQYPSGIASGNSLFIF